MEAHWGGAGFGALRMATRDGRHLFEAEVRLAELEPGARCGWNYARGGAVPPEMERAAGRRGEAGVEIYAATVSATRPASDYTPRLMPQCRRRRDTVRGTADPLAAMTLIEKTKP